ncbi:MAG: hypothetical protein M0P01_11240 [Treponema sp.]|nr:hypothetical protein [Treponema sp.]
MKMLAGYENSVINSRDVYSIDTTGESEKKIYETWKERSSALRQNGFINFAQKTDQIADFYLQESERNKALAEPENFGE